MQSGNQLCDVLFFCLNIKLFSCSILCYEGFHKILRCLLTLLILEMEYSGFGVNTMPADALAPKLARASAGMVLAV